MNDGLSDLPTALNGVSITATSAEMSASAVLRPPLPQSALPRESPPLPPVPQRALCRSSCRKGLTLTELLPSPRLPRGPQLPHDLALTVGRDSKARLTFLGASGRFPLPRDRAATLGGVLLRLELLAARLVAGVSRLARRGGGTTIPGKLVSKVHPGAVDQLAAKLPDGAVIVSATNGKTTAAAMAAHIL